MSDTPHHAPALRQQFLSALNRCEDALSEFTTTAGLALDVVRSVAERREEGVAGNNLHFFRSVGWHDAARRLEDDLYRDREYAEIAREYLVERWAEGQDLPASYNIEPLMNSTVPEVREFGLQAVQYIADKG